MNIGRKTKAETIKKCKLQTPRAWTKIDRQMGEMYERERDRSMARL